MSGKNLDGQENGASSSKRRRFSESKRSPEVHHSHAGTLFTSQEQCRKTETEAKILGRTGKITNRKYSHQEAGANDSAETERTNERRNPCHCYDLGMECPHVSVLDQAGGGNDEEIRECCAMTIDTHGARSKFRLHKTELCLLWKRKGSCRYGPDCIFAQGNAELNIRHTNPLDSSIGNALDSAPGNAQPPGPETVQQQQQQQEENQEHRFMFKWTDVKKIS